MPMAIRIYDKASKKENRLVDRYGRVARKLRISVTDRCNMQCVYCMPKGNDKWFEDRDVLTFPQIIRLGQVFAGLGIEKIRITGGEPTLRKDIERLVGGLSKISRIKSVSMTTNGLLLSSKVNQLKDAGLGGVNISLDTFKPDRFKAMTGLPHLDRVKRSIDAALDAGLEVKINTVVIRGWNDDEVVDFAKFALDTGITVRFIEFMPLDGSEIWSPDLVFSKREMIAKIEESLGRLEPSEAKSKDATYAPARLYSIEGRGTVGFIPSITEPFCNNCDRIRITANGYFMTCLFENPGYHIKPMLDSGRSDSEIGERILQMIEKKPEGIAGIIRTKSLRPALNMMNRIGG
jgi:cyclic pyranopterin phosphate synthase